MRVKFGDIIEFKTAKGLAYAIYTHRHVEPPRYGPVIRVFDRLFESRPTDITELVTIPIRFSTLFPIQIAINKNMGEVIGNIPLPDALKPFPVFRNGTPHPETKKVAVWWLWDGEKEWRVNDLTLEQRKLSFMESPSYPLLISRIEKGWRLETDPR